MDLLQEFCRSWVSSITASSTTVSTAMTGRYGSMARLSLPAVFNPATCAVSGCKPIPGIRLSRPDVRTRIIPQSFSNGCTSTATWLPRMNQSGSSLEAPRTSVAATALMTTATGCLTISRSTIVPSPLKKSSSWRRKVDRAVIPAVRWDLCYSETFVLNKEMHHSLNLAICCISDRYSLAV